MTPPVSQKRPLVGPTTTAVVKKAVNPEAAGNLWSSVLQTELFQDANAPTIPVPLEAGDWCWYAAGRLSQLHNCACRRLMASASPVAFPLMKKCAYSDKMQGVLGSTVFSSPEAMRQWLHFSQP